MNKKLLLIFIFSGALCSNVFGARGGSIAHTILVWARFEQEINPVEKRGINVSCVQRGMKPDLLTNHWNASWEYAQCGTPFEQAGKSQDYIDNGPCKKQYQNVIKFHEAMRSIMEGCAVNVDGEEKPQGWFKVIHR